VSQRLVFDEPKLVNNKSIAIVGYLFHVQVSFVGDEQARVAVIITAKSRPRRHLGDEIVPFFTAALGSIDKQQQSVVGYCWYEIKFYFNHFIRLIRW